MPVPEPELRQLTPSQVAKLERLVRAGFKFVTFERFARYPAAEKNGFVALLDTAAGRIKIFGQVGYHLGEGIGVLIELGAGKFFVWKEQTVAATPELLQAYLDFRRDLQAILEESGSEQ